MEPSQRIELYYLGLQLGIFVNTKTEQVSLLDDIYNKVPVSGSTAALALNPPYLFITNERTNQVLRVDVWPGDLDLAEEFVPTFNQYANETV